MNIDVKNLLFDLVIYGLGFGVVSLFGLKVSKFLNNISDHIDSNPPAHIDQETWSKILKPGNEQAGKWLGRFERLFFYITFITKSWILIGFWLTFKVASKWETWQNIVKVPEDEVEGFNLGVLDRRNWGDRVLQRFLLGTMANAFAGFFGYLFAYILQILKVLLPCI